MTIAVLAKNKQLSPWLTAFQQYAPDIKVIDGLSVLQAATAESSARVQAQIEEVTCALVWNHPQDSLNQWPNLKLIISMGAGVDHIFADPTLNRTIPIARVIDQSLAQDICEYVLSIMLSKNRQLLEYHQKQQQQVWQPTSYKALQSTRVTVLGLGKLGQAVCNYLNPLGCQLSGWSRTQKKIADVECFSGQQQLGSAVGDADFIICLLPLTKDTKGILNSEIFAQCKQGAYLINVGRGGSLLVNDLFAALDNQQLSGAALDTFATEPLPKNDPLWQRSDILITPHIAATTQPISVVPQIVENYRRLTDNQPLINRVDPVNEY